MGTRALDDFLVGVDQRVGLARERRDLLGELPGQPLGAAGADGGKAVGNALERRQAEPHLEHGGEQQHRGEDGKGDDQRLIEGMHFVGDLGGVAGDRDEIMSLVAEIDVALDQPQPLILGPGDIALARAVRPGRHAAVLKMRQAGVPQRTRGAHVVLVWVEPRHLPVPARQRQFEQRLAERLREFVARLLRRSDVGHQRAQIDVEPAVEGALDRLPIDRGQHQPGDQQDHYRPGGGRDEQAQREGVGAHRGRPAIPCCHLIFSVHDLIRKPVPTFRDHAPGAASR